MSYFDVVYMDHELSPRAKTVCMYLHDRANREGESWYAINTIASDLGLSRSTVKRALGDLVRQGRVEKKTTVSKKRRLYLQPLSAAMKKERNPPPRGDCAH